MGNVLLADFFMVGGLGAFGPAFGNIQRLAGLVLGGVFGMDTHVQHGPNVRTDLGFKIYYVFRREQVFTAVVVGLERDAFFFNFAEFGQAVNLKSAGVR